MPLVDPSGGALARPRGTNLVLQDAVQAVLQAGQRMGMGDHDLSALVTVFATDQQRRA